MKWLRIWFFEDSIETEVTGIIIGTHNDYTLTVRLDSGEIINVTQAEVRVSCWVDNPAKKISKPVSNKK